MAWYRAVFVWSYIDTAPPSTAICVGILMVGTIEVLYNREFLFTDFHGRLVMPALHWRVHTGPRDHPASRVKGTGFLSWRTAAGVWR
jgi:hypothetical protein